MRRVTLFAAAILVMSTAGTRTTKALPRYGIERYYYSNICYMTANCRSFSPGQPGSLIGVRNTGCTGSYNTISESDLIGYDNWKEEIVTDCETFALIEQTLSHGGYQNWTAKTPSANCYCDF